MDFWCERHKVMCEDWCEQCLALDLSNRIEQQVADMWQRIAPRPSPKLCDCRGIVHTCNTVC